MSTELGEILEKQVCEDATGCNANPHGLGKFYDDDGCEISTDRVFDILIDGKTVEVPNAGAGSFREVFELAGFQKTEVFEWGSSAGDWSFAVFDGSFWMPAFQSNRYPRHGFMYSVDASWQFHDLQDCFKYMSSGD